jgi:hypothetical protein
LNAERRNEAATDVSGRRSEESVSTLSSSVDEDEDDRLCDDIVADAQRRRSVGINVPVQEYWQILETSLDGTMSMFLRLFVPKSGVLQKKKSVKWLTLHQKVIVLGVLTKTQFDSRVENLTHRLCVIGEELTDLETAPLASEDIEDIDVETT